MHHRKDTENAEHKKDSYERELLEKRDATDFWAARGKTEDSEFWATRGKREIHSEDERVGEKMEKKETSQTDGDFWAVRGKREAEVVDGSGIKMSKI